MTGWLLSMSGALGVYLLYTRWAFGRRTVLLRRRAGRGGAGSRWLAEAGLRDVRWRDVVAVCSTVGLLTALVAWTLFGGIAPGVVAGLAAAFTPVATHRSRRSLRLALAQDAWPRMIEEIRLLVSSAGLSIPQALFLVGRRAPADLAASFEIAHREWLLTTDFARAVAVLKDELAHPTADITCETLLTAHSVGGVDLDRRLRDLADDRMADVQARKDARAKMAGARFARVFVLIVPLGMALVGLSVGRGRVAYSTASGQVLVVAGLFTMLACWFWAGRIMSIPAERRVFAR